jgi:hypothetical protein
LVLSPEERKIVMERLAQAQEDYPILIRDPGCPMYPLILQEKNIKPKHFPAELLRRIPYYGRGCAAGMPMGYVMVLLNGEVNPCMLLQINLGNKGAEHNVYLGEFTCISPTATERITKGRVRSLFL